MAISLWLVIIIHPIKKIRLSTKDSNRNALAQPSAEKAALKNYRKITLG